MNVASGYSLRAVPIASSDMSIPVTLPRSSRRGIFAPAPQPTSRISLDDWDRSVALQGIGNARNRLRIYQDKLLRRLKEIEVPVCALETTAGSEGDTSQRASDGSNGACLGQGNPEKYAVRDEIQDLVTKLKDINDGSCNPAKTATKQSPESQPWLLIVVKYSGGFSASTKSLVNVNKCPLIPSCSSYAYKTRKCRARRLSSRITSVNASGKLQPVVQVVATRFLDAVIELLNLCDHLPGLCERGCSNYPHLSWKYTSAG